MQVNIVWPRYGRESRPPQGGKIQKLPQAGHNAQIQGILYTPISLTCYETLLSIRQVPSLDNTKTASASRWQTFLT
jgi:hypothetical protein